MHLRTCIALECLIGAVLVAGIAGCFFFVSNGVRANGGQSVQAATATPHQLAGSQGLTESISSLALASDTSPSNLPQSDTFMRSKRSTVPADPDPAPVLAGGSFHGIPDEQLMEPLRFSPLAAATLNKGGSSISLRVDLENGARAAFKPEQRNLQSVPRREIVAYRVSRLLGLSAVAPAIGRRFEMSELLEAARSESAEVRARLQDEIIQRNGWVAGELSWWIPVIRAATIDGFDLDSMEGIVSWKRYLKIGAEIPKQHRALLSQVSDMVFFDYIINNSDRWSGGNVRVSQDRKLLYFMDNTLSFGDSESGHRKAKRYLERCELFSRSLVEMLRMLSETQVRDVLEKDVEPFRWLLEEKELKAMMSRRILALKYIDSLIREHGENNVLIFP